MKETNGASSVNSAEALFGIKVNRPEPEWVLSLLEEQGFGKIEVPNLQRKNIDTHEYLIYSGEDEPKTIHADTAIEAMEQSELESADKIVHANCRLDDVIKQDRLEQINGEEAKPSAEEPPAAEPPAE